MEDRSNVRQNWYSPGTVIKLPAGDLHSDVLIRWNERIAMRKTEDGISEAEYIYDAQRTDVLVPKGASIDGIKTTLLQKVRGGMKLPQDKINAQYIVKLSAESFKAEALKL